MCFMGLHLLFNLSTIDSYGRHFAGLLNSCLYNGMCVKLKELSSEFIEVWQKYSQALQKEKMMEFFNKSMKLRRNKIKSCFLKNVDFTVHYWLLGRQFHFQTSRYLFSPATYAPRKKKITFFPFTNALKNFLLWICQKKI